MGCDTQTALAEAELEYNDKHKSVAVHVKFPVVSENLYKYSELKGHAVEFGKLKLLIWTSTPWTIPLNRAICVNENMTYTLIQNVTETLVVAKSLAEQVLKIDPSYKIVNIDIPGSVLTGTFTLILLLMIQRNTQFCMEIM